MKAVRPTAILLAVVAVAGLTAAVLFAPVIARQAQAWWAARPDPVPATAAQQQAIVRAILSDTGLRNLSLPGQYWASDRPYTLLVDETVLTCGASRASYDAAECSKRLQAWPGFRARYSFAPIKLRRELVESNRQSLALQVPQSQRFHLVAADKLQVRTEDPAWWQHFYHQHPQANGLLRISRATLGTNRDVALVQVAIDCATYEGRRGLLLLDHKRGRWHVDEAVAQVLPKYWYDSMQNKIEKEDPNPYVITTVCTFLENPCGYP